MPALAFVEDMGAAGIYARTSPVLGRYVQVGVASGRVISVSFPEEPDEEAEQDHELLDRFNRYFEGNRDTFEDVAVALTVPTEHRIVLNAVRNVPYGDDVSVGQLVGMIPGLDEDDLEVVRQALATNPVPILIPEHRVSDGPRASPPDVWRALRSIEGL